MAPILDGTGDSPPGFHTRGREGAIAVRRTAAKRSPEALGRPDGDVPIASKKWIVKCIQRHYTSMLKQTEDRSETCMNGALAHVTDWLLRASSEVGKEYLPTSGCRG